MTQILDLAGPQSGPFFFAPRRARVACILLLGVGAAATSERLFPLKYLIMANGSPEVWLVESLAWIQLPLFCAAVTLLALTDPPSPPSQPIGKRGNLLLLGVIQAILNLLILLEPFTYGSAVSESPPYFQLARPASWLVGTQLTIAIYSRLRRVSLQMGDRIFPSVCRLLCVFFIVVVLGKIVMACVRAGPFVLRVIERERCTIGFGSIEELWSFQDLRGPQTFFGPAMGITELAAACACAAALIYFTYRTSRPPAHSTPR